MPIIRDYGLKENSAAVSDHTGSMPTHQTNDLLLWILSKNDGVGGNFITPTGNWNLGEHVVYGAGGGTNTVRAAWYWKIASSSAEVAPHTLNSDPDTYHSVLFAIRGVKVEQPINAFSSRLANANPLLSPHLTASSGSCMIIYAAASDGGVQCNNYPSPNVMHVYGQDATNNGAGAAWTIQYASGVSPPCRFYTNNLVNDETCLITIAVNDNGSGSMPAYVDNGAPSASLLLEPFVGVTPSQGGTFPGSLSIAAIGPKATVFDAAAATADYGLNPYHAVAGSTPAVATAVQSSGFQFIFPAVKNLNEGLVLFSCLAANPRDYIDQGTISEVANLITFTSGTTYESFHYTAQGASPDFRNRMLGCVQLNNTASVYASSPTPPTLTSISATLFTTSCPRGAITYYISQMCLLNKLTIAGGSSTEPIDIEGLKQCGTHYPLPYFESQGASEILSYIPIQFGGSTGSLNLQLDATAIQFPRAYSTSFKQLNFHVSASAVGIEYYPKAGDTIKHTNSIVTSPSRYYWKIHPSASTTASCTWDFSGLTVVGAHPVQLYPVMTFDAMTFSQCGQIQAISSCSLSNCAISKPITGSISAIRIHPSSSLTNVTLTTATATDIAIEMPVTGTYNLSNVIFTGFTTDVFVTATTGTVTINVLDGGDTPTSASLGAVVIVNNTRTFELTGLVVGSEVRIYRTSDDVLLAGEESVASSTFTYQYNYVSDVPIYVVIFSLSYKEIRMTTLSLGATNQSIPIQQQTDRVYSNP